ncbi:C-type lectin 37Db [Bulinus truncatus]|nr:C-type lectin 37Db [Bulinus truncatus]
MSELFLSSLCIFAIVVLCTDGCLHFEANPTGINIGITERISFNCTFRYTENSAITNVTQITIAKYEQGNLTEIASIKRHQDVGETPFHSDLFTEEFFDREDVSTLAVHWRGLVLDDAGTYVCLIKGFDNSGLVHEVEETLSVTFNVSELCSVAQKPLPYLFFPPKVHNGSYYYLSMYWVSNPTEAEEECLKLGGYLMEVDDEEEMEVASELLQPYDIWATLIAGTDADQEGTWVFPRTGKPVPHLKWREDQPDNYLGNEHCIAIHFWGKDEINDIKCTNHFSFICEVNELDAFSQRSIDTNDR